jgi:hypothetical protein
MYGYLKKFRSAAIRVKTEDPDFSELPDQEFDWCQTVYGNVNDETPKDIPPPLGKTVTLVTYVDANVKISSISSGKLFPLFL